MRRIWTLVLTTGACGFSPSASTHVTGDGGGSDLLDAFVKQDAAADAPDGIDCFGTQMIDKVCFKHEDLPSTGFSVNGETTINTGTSSQCSTKAMVASGQDVCVIVATKLTINGTGRLHVIGSKPAIFVATELTDLGININTGGILDASTFPSQTGAGARSALCDLGTNAATMGAEPLQKGGAYGGSFAALGGSGGTGANSGDIGGVPPPVVAALTTLQGGCPGGIGGGNPGDYARGGGALALVAATIKNDGLVVAGGNGGLSAANGGVGGNGGGAGGMIVLDSMVDLQGGGKVEARGGGGGEGVGGNAGVFGLPGYNPFGPDSTGGSGGSSGGDGGDGAPRTGEMHTGGAGTDGTSGAGGGGGGGASGVIFTSMANTSISFAPDATQM